MRAERLVALLFTLQRRQTATIAELAEALDVSERTMHRDIAALQNVGVPLWTEPGRHGGVRLVDGWRSRLDGLTTREAVAIFAMGVPRALTELGLGNAVAAAHAKVTATLPTPLRDQAQHVAQRFHLDAPTWFSGGDGGDHNEGVLGELAAAVWHQRRMRIDYRRGDTNVTRTVEPLGLVLKAGVWYLVARVSGTDDIRTYRAGRIGNVDDLGEPFDRPTDFDLAGWWQRSSARFERSVRRCDVRVRLSPVGMRILPRALDAEVVAGALATADEGADGWTDVTLALEEPRIAAGQLLPFGPEVHIVEPAEVRDHYVDLATRMIERNTLSGVRG